MLITIITINYNNKVGLEQTIKSVQNQTFTNYEYIVIDGDSTDGSKTIIEANKQSFSYWVSEPDTGVYNAMNKGIKASKGKYLLFLNSGDVLFNTSVLENVSRLLDTKFDVIYGDILLQLQEGNEVLRKHPKNLSFNYLYNKTIAHQSTFIKRNLFETNFYYNEDLKIVSDWEFLIYVICKKNVPYKYIDVVISKYDDAYGISSLPENKALLNRERREILETYFPLFIEDYKLLNKQNNILSSNRFKMLLSLESSMFAKKINSVYLRILSWLFIRK